MKLAPKIIVGMCLIFLGFMAGDLLGYGKGVEDCFEYFRTQGQALKQESYRKQPKDRAASLPTSKQLG